MWREATLLLRKRRWSSRAIDSPLASPILWKWCNRKKPLPARTNSTSQACTVIILQKFPWLARLASPKTASGNTSRKNKHGGRKPSPSGSCGRQRVPDRTGAGDRYRVYLALLRPSKTPKNLHYSDRRRGTAGWRLFFGALLPA